MNPLLFLLLFCLCLTSPTSAEDAKFSDMVDARIIFRKTDDPRLGYPHSLLVYIVIRNQHDGAVWWVCNSVTDLEAEVFDASGHPAAVPSSVSCISSNSAPFYLPYGSTLEWLVSQGGMSLSGDREGTAALQIGGRGWLLPQANLSSYSLKLRLKGVLSQREDDGGRPKIVLLDLPATPIKLEPK